MESRINHITPIFIFSLPRSGSTLLQKIIASSDEVSTSAEPWIMLPLLYSQKQDGTLSEYSHNKAVAALNDLKQGLLVNSAKYDDILVEFILSIYNGLSDPRSKYFLDKTPRYYLIIDDISKIFPNAKSIFLFRDPMSQLASKMVRHNGRFKTLYSDYIDIIEGPNLLESGYEKMKSKSLKITYSELINCSESMIEKLNHFLEIKIENNIVNNLSTVDLKGTMGDPLLLSNKSNNISNMSLNKWKDIFNTPIRRFIAFIYLKRINDNYFILSGTNRNTVIQEIREIKYKNLFTFQDCYDLLYCYLNLIFKANIFFSVKLKWSKYKKLD
jgi:hypothetical protein